MIHVKQLSKKFKNKTVYQNLNLTFKPNRSYALIGQSGSGKTTLLNALGRLDKPTDGQIIIDDKNIFNIKERTFFKEYLGYVFQNYALLDNQSVLKNLKLVSRNQKKIEETLSQVGLNSSYLKTKVYELSGGQAQRVAIARMILKPKKIILADEPTGALDEKTGEEIIKILLNQVNPDTYVIIATHDPNVYSKVDEIIDITKIGNAHENS
ncbi:ATP-binding cassette domain-containing protein [Convivina intestini]|uniref:ATP-binding cassette domain-containing protein n=1 Tax=Convivina intestini TaxID=1505726 RepID=UPI00200BC999|nr:ATP-binding cassette domain-containing protein [Convivina intestini]CAH1855108.1 ABC transporter ATP-binding protein YxdL [Convivina intestini]